MTARSERVLHVLAQRPGRTGSGVTLEALVRAAGARGWDQHVVVGVPAGERPDVGGLPPERIAALAFETEELQFRLPGMSDVMPYPSSRFSALAADELARYRAAWRRHLTRALDSSRPDVVHVHHLWIVAALVAELAPDVRTVAHSHGTGLRQMELAPRIAREVVPALRAHDGFLALHAEQARSIARALSVPPERVTVVGAGYREALFHGAGRSAAARGRSLLYAGKLSAAKGVEELAHAFRALRARDAAVELHVAGAGAGAEGERLRELLASIDGVVLHGALAPEALAERMRAADVLVLPSFYEGLPLVLVEGAASGCRLVATDLPGVRALRPELDPVLWTVPPPALASVDRPEPAARAGFVRDLTDALGVALAAPRPGAIDLAAFTWDAVFQRIERVWRAPR